MPKRLPDWVRQKLYFTFKHATGSCLQERLAWLRSNQFHPVEINQYLQEGLLSRLLEETALHVPFYRDRFRETGIIDRRGRVSCENFNHLPVLTRDELREHQADLFHQYPERFKRIRSMPSGGTTGDPVTPYGDMTYWDWCWAQTLLYYEWMGLEAGMPYMYFWGAPQDLGSSHPDWRYRLLLEGVQQRKVLNCRILSDDIMAHLIDEINQSSGHRHMVAYTNELYDLARFSQEVGMPVTRPMSGILTTTAALLPDMRETIENVFNCPAYSRYGAREVGDIAAECEFQRGLHINPLYARVDVLNDENEPVYPGEEGRIIITMLHNRLMPLLRYEIQDLGIMQEPGTCLCGRSWPTFSRITGRASEKLNLSDGRVMGKVFFHYIMEPFTRLQRYQIVELGGNRIQMSLVSSDPNYISTHYGEVCEAERRFKMVAGQTLDVCFKQVDDVERSPSGKVKLIVKLKPASALSPV